MMHIDVGSVLRRTVAASFYSNLVTRPTGAAVRAQIELLLQDERERSLAMLDFSQVSMIDVSCADEIVAKLLLVYAAETAPRDAYFVFRGIGDAHHDAIESVLEHHGLALVAEAEGGPQVLGVLDEDARAIWQALVERGPASAADLAGTLRDDVRTTIALEQLVRRRLAMRHGGRYVALGATHA